ncbi:MAG: hypothetical protein WA958_00490 [Tunicatimonas sp.]
MNTRTIRYVDPDEDILQEEVAFALTKTMEERFKIYCDLIASLYAMSGIDVMKQEGKKVITYVDNE